MAKVIRIDGVVIDDGEKKIPPPLVVLQSCVAVLNAIPNTPLGAIGVKDTYTFVSQLEQYLKDLRNGVQVIS